MLNGNADIQNPFVLFCAGEDSGDCIGESLIRESRTGKFDFVGAGGPRMQSAGLKSLVDYETLPVSGFGDVLPKYLRLRQSYDILQKALEDSRCLGLVAIDYPGFNMKLVRLAGQLNKPSLYVAPPQVWAWKAKRAKILASIPKTKLAVFFEFEKDPYQREGGKVSLLQHPFVEVSKFAAKKQTDSTVANELRKKTILLLPGSREKQALRNVPVLLKIAECVPSQNFTVVAARSRLLPKIQESVRRYFKGRAPAWLQIVTAPADGIERSLLYRNSKSAITAPGTATLELALSGCPFIVCTKPDSLTYCLGKRFVKTQNFALPNIILQERVYAEFIQSRWTDSLYKKAAEALENANSAAQSKLWESLSQGQTSAQLMSEFLAQFL